MSTAPSGCRYRAPAVDRRYNDWHYSLSSGCEYMDLDGVEFDKKREPIMLVETSTNPEKATTVIRNLARRANVDAYLVLLPKPSIALTDETIITVTRVWDHTVAAPNRKVRQMTLKEWGDRLERLHAH